MALQWSVVAGRWHKTSGGATSAPPKNESTGSGGRGPVATFSKTRPANPTLFSSTKAGKEAATIAADQPKAKVKAKAKVPPASVNATVQNLEAEASKLKKEKNAEAKKKQGPGNQA